MLRDLRIHVIFVLLLSWPAQPATGMFAQSQADLVPGKQNHIIHVLWDKFQKLDQLHAEYNKNKHAVASLESESKGSSTYPEPVELWGDNRLDHLRNLLTIAAEANDMSWAERMIQAGRTESEQDELRRVLTSNLLNQGELQSAVPQITRLSPSYAKIELIQEFSRLAAKMGDAAIDACAQVKREQMPAAGTEMPDALFGLVQGTAEDSRLTESEADEFREAAWTHLAVALAGISHPKLDSVRTEIKQDRFQDVVTLEVMCQNLLRQPVVVGSQPSFDGKTIPTTFKTKAGQKLAARVLIEDCFRHQALGSIGAHLEQFDSETRHFLSSSILSRVDLLQQSQPTMARQFVLWLFTEHFVSSEIIDSEEAFYGDTPEESLINMANDDSAIAHYWRSGVRDPISTERILHALIAIGHCQSGMEMLEQIQDPNRRQDWMRSSLQLNFPKLSEADVRQIAASFQQEFGAPIISDLEARIFRNHVWQGNYADAWSLFEKQTAGTQATNWGLLLVLFDQAAEREQNVLTLRKILQAGYREKMNRLSDAQSIDLLNMECLNLSVQIGRNHTFSVTMHPLYELLLEKAQGTLELPTAYTKLSSILFSFTSFIDPQSPVMYQQLIDEMLQTRITDLADSRHQQMLQLLWLIDKTRLSLPNGGRLGGFGQSDFLANVSDSIPWSVEEMTKQFPVLAEWSSLLAGLTPAEQSLFRVQEITRLLARKYAATGNWERTVAFVDSLPDPFEAFELLLQIAPQFGNSPARKQLPFRIPE